MVEGYVGRPGTGKTALCTWRAWHAKRAGKPVYANVPLIDTRVKRPRRYWGFGPRLQAVPVDPDGYGKMWADGMLKDLREVLALDNALVLLDEVHMWLPSTEWTSLPFEVRRYLAQQRKRGIDIWWTAQANARVLNVVRELTACLHQLRRLGPVIICDAEDPESKESYGRTYHLIGRHVWDLYNTEYEVGSADGEQEGRIGLNLRYEKQRQALAREDAKAQGRRVYRIEHPDGWVSYSYEPRIPEVPAVTPEEEPESSPGNKLESILAFAEVAALARSKSGLEIVAAGTENKNGQGHHKDLAPLVF